MNKKEIEEKIKLIIEFVRKEVYGKGKDFSPMGEIVMVNEKGERSSFVLVLADTDAVEHRRKVLNKFGQEITLGRFSMKGSPLALFFSSEAWASVYGKDVDINNVPLPSKDPNRKEIFIISATNASRASFIKVFDIKRSEDKVELIESKEGEGLTMENYLHDAFWDGYYSKIPNA